MEETPEDVSGATESTESGIATSPEAGGADSSPVARRELRAEQSDGEKARSGSLEMELTAPTFSYTYDPYSRRIIEQSWPDQTNHWKWVRCTHCEGTGMMAGNEFTRSSHLNYLDSLKNLSILK